MPIFFRQFFLAVLLLLSFTAQAIEITDASGRVVVLPKPAERIVALSPHLVENLFSIGAGDKVVATIAFADYPEAAKQIPRIGSLQQISVESILGYNPDLVLVWESGTSPAIVQQLRELGLPVFSDEPRTLNDVAQSLLNLGELTGNSLRAQQIVGWYHDRLGDLQKRYSHRQSMKVFYQVWFEPLQTINGEHLISHVMELCGGHNVFADAQILAPRVGIESLLVRNPDVIVASQPLEVNSPLLNQWSQWPQINAVKNKQVYEIEPDLLERQTLRIVEGAQQLCRFIDQSRK